MRIRCVRGTLGLEWMPLTGESLRLLREDARRSFDVSERM